MFMLKLWICSILVSMLIAIYYDCTYDSQKGFTVKELICMLFIMILGPIGTCLVISALIEEISDTIKEILDYQLIKPKKKIISKDRLKKVCTNEVVSGLDKLPPPLPKET